MAQPSSAPSPRAPDSFDAQEKFLILKTDEAVRDGSQVERWIRENDRKGALRLFPIDLEKKFRLPNRAEGFFDTLLINGQPRSVMGCVQTVEFGSAPGPSGGERLKQFVLGEFLSRAHWTYADGYPGGFGVEQSLYKTGDGRYGRFSGEQTKGCIDLAELGTPCEWTLLTVRIYDFVMEFLGKKAHMKEAACVAPTTSFVHVVDNPSPEYRLEVTIGYPFVEFAPIPNVFGFGPGKFGVAIKTYSFYLKPDGAIRVRMFFAAAPRCKKVLDFGKYIPDPVYGGAALLSLLSLGSWNPQKFHDRLDSFMLSQHGRVHQALMDGAANVWTEWYEGGIG